MFINIHVLTSCWNADYFTHTHN